MDFYFIRHGQTPYNVEGRYYGEIEAELTPKGREMTTALAKNFHIQPDIIYCSSQVRARQTLDILQDQQPSLLDIETRYSDQLVEKSFGIWEGLTADEIQDQDPETWHRFIQRPFDTTPKGAESYEAFSNRVLAKFKKIQEEDQESVLIVGHQGVFRLIVHEYFEKDRDFWDISFKQDQYYKYQL